MLATSRKERLLVQQVGEELVVYDQDRHWAHRLNQAAALIWQHCDGKTTIPQLASLLKSRLNLPADEELVWHALKRLEKAHLVRESATRPVHAVSRRQLLRKFAKVAALGLLVPAVTTIVAPTPAMAQTMAMGGTCNCIVAMQPPAPSTGCPSPGPVGATATTTAMGNCMGTSSGCTGSCTLTATWTCEQTGWLLTGRSHNCPRD